MRSLCIATLVVLTGVARADHPIEVGVFGGIHDFSDKIELGSFDDDPTNDTPQVAPVFGVRGAIRVIPHLAVDVQLGFMASGARNGVGSYDVPLYRASLLFYPLRERRFRPFVEAGFGAESAFPSGHERFDETDPMVHAGLGGEFAITPRYGVRLDAIALFPPARFGHGFTTDVEVTVGVYIRLGAKKATVAAPTTEAVVVNPEDRDTDGDGIDDAHDKCPTLMETKNGFEDEDGCPDEVPAELTKLNGPIAGLEFDQGAATIKKSTTKVLDPVADVLKKYPSVMFEIDGYTDDQGKPDENTKLSGARADAVKAYLVGKGVDASRLSAVGHGPANPIADNKTRDGRAKNRRVEMKMVTP